MAEKEYIERDALLQDLALAPDYWYKGRTIDAILNKQPAADVVEVVRCENCRHGQCNNSGQLRGHYILASKGMLPVRSPMPKSEQFTAHAP